MPLNIQDNEGRSGSQTPAPPPFNHVPSDSGGRTGRTIGIVFAVLVLLAAIFLLYTYGVFDGRKSAQQATSTSPEQSQQPATAEAPAPGAAPAQGSTTDRTTTSQETTSITAPAPSAHFVAGKGNLTIYIGSYKQRGIAEGEIGRWQNAGFEAHLKETPEWFQVQLGRFMDVSETRDLIDTLKDGFEGGYWVGPA